MSLQVFRATLERSTECVIYLLAESPGLAERIAVEESSEIFRRCDYYDNVYLHDVPIDIASVPRGEDFVILDVRGRAIRLNRSEAERLLTRELKSEDPWDLIRYVPVGAGQGKLLWPPPPALCSQPR